MILREATADDSALLLEWRNAGREFAFDSRVIPPEEHQRWFDNPPPTRHIFIAEEKGVPVGQVRFDEAVSGIEVDVFVAEPHRGKGIGKFLIVEGIRAIGAGRFVAHVKPNNLPSQRLFLSCGFRLESDTDVRTFVYA